ncbi:MAG: hypothetical protein AB1609_10160 [Bacillota bacterium]
MSLSLGVEPGQRRRVVLSGMAASAGLVAFYLAIVALAQDPAHAFQQFRDDLWFIAPITLGFGTQVALYVYLRRLHRASRGHVAVTAGSTGVSGTAMLACCAHHLADVLPVVGLSGAAIFLNDIKTPLALVGLAMNVAGVIYMGRHVRRMRRTLPSVAASTAAPACHRPA